MGDYEEDVHRGFVSQKVDDFLEIRREKHLGVLLYGLDDSKTLDSFRKMFRDEFGERGENVDVEISYNGIEAFPKFSGGIWSKEEDSFGYYSLNLGVLLRR